MNVESKQRPSEATPVEEATLPRPSANEETPFLTVRGIHKQFGGIHALRGVTLSIRAGEIYHLLGENGCGKSTLIKIISGAQPPDQGSIELAGTEYARLDPTAALAAGVATVYQDLSLMPNMTVAENVGLTEQLVIANGNLAKRLNHKLLHETAARALEKVFLPRTAEFLETPASELPLAIRQLIAIARAVATKARLVVMDEPTTSLTRREVDHLIEVVRRLQGDNVAVLFVTHKLDECYRIGGEAIVLRDGECVAQGPIASFSKSRLGELMTGKTLENTRFRTGARGGAPLVHVKALSFADQFRDASFELRRGEILGITGLLDSGRNAVILALAGVQPATSGSIEIDGREVELRTPADALAHGIGYVPEDRLIEGLFLDKPINVNLVTLVLNRISAAFGIINKRKSRAFAQGLAFNLKIVTPSLDLPVSSLSGGNQQRVLIGRALSNEPKILLLHGPTVGVDVGSKQAIYQIVQTQADKGVSVIIISDDLPELVQNCDRILVMRQGRIEAEFQGDAAEEQQILDVMVANSDASPQRAERRQ